MELIMSENDTPSLQTKEAITDGVNWLANWYKESCEAGKISSAEYEKAIEKLKQVKIYTTQQGVNRVTEELEKGNLHFKPELIKRGANIQSWKDLMAQKNTFPLGWCARSNIEEPVIIIDVAKIKEKYGDNPQAVTSTVVHELTHMTADVFDAERDVKQILSGKNIDNKAKQKQAFNQINNATVAPVNITPTIIPDTNTPLVVPQVDNAKVLLNNNSDKTYDYMNKGVPFNAYLDNESEIYARIMELRYNAGLKAGEPIKDEELNKIQDNDDVINRYKPQIVTSILNDVATVPNIKNQMKQDAASAQLLLAQIDANPNKKEAEHANNKTNISSVVFSRYKNNTYS